MSETDDLLTLARERFRLSADGEAELRTNQLADKKFAAGDHWPEAIKKAREADGRPCLVIDRLTPMMKQVTNQLRQARPAIQVTPFEDGDVETGEVLAGLIRHVENISNADVAYDQAGADATTIGRGYYRILTEYESAEGFNLEIKIKRIRNPFTVYFDPRCQEIDYSDARFAFVVEDLSLAEYKAQYPTSQAAGLSDFTSIGDDERHWFSEDTVRIAEYWYVETDYVSVPNPTGGKPRQAERRTVHCKKINAIEILEDYDWPGKYIPIVPVIGEEIDINGKVDYRGMVRRARDPQRMFDVWKSATTEAIGLAPKSPFIMAEGQDEGYEEMWRQANTRNFPALKYKPVSFGGTYAPAPKRDVSEPPIQALMASSQAAENDLRATTGFYDVGEQDRREHSGRAILARQKQGELGNSDYADGLKRALRHGGRILIDLFPKVYDTPRIRRIMGKDNQPKQVMVHAGQPPQEPTGDGIEGVYDLSAGHYDVVLSAGPSFESARQEFVELMSGLYQSKPELLQLTGDIFFENLDIPHARQMAERLKKMLPPQLQDEPDGEEPIPQAAQMQMQQMNEQLQMVQQAAQQMNQVIEGKQLEIESKERIVAAELDLKWRLAEMQADVDRFKASLEATGKQTQIQAEDARAAMKANVELEAQQVDLSHDAVQRDTDRILTATSNASEEEA